MTDKITFENITDREKALVLATTMSTQALLSLIPEKELLKMIKGDPSRFNMYIITNLVGCVLNKAKLTSKDEFANEVFAEAKKEFDLANKEKIRGN